MAYYIVMDGRADFDLDAASVLESIGEMPVVDATAVMMREWAGCDARLVEFDIAGDEIHDGRVVASALAAGRAET